MQCKAGSGMGDGLSPAAQKAYISSLSETLSQPNKSHRPVRIEDVIRRSEVNGVMLVARMLSEACRIHNATMVDLLCVVYVYMYYHICSNNSQYKKYIFSWYTVNYCVGENCIIANYSSCEIGGYVHL